MLTLAHSVFFSGGFAGAGNLILRGELPFDDVLLTGVPAGGAEVQWIFDSSVPEIRAYLNGNLNNVVPQLPIPIIGAGPYKIGGYGTSAGMLTTDIIDDFKFYNSVPTGIDYINGDPLFGTVPANDSTSVTIKFNSTGLLGGDYNANIVILSNDPVTPELRVGAHLFVTGDALIAADDSLIFPDPVFVNGTDVDTLVLENTGNGQLSVTDITSDNAVFTVDTTAFDIAPFSTFNVLVSYSPTAAGTDNATLTVTNSSSNNPSLTVAVQGEAVDAPLLSVSPDSIGETLVFGDSTDLPVALENLGGFDLIYSVGIAGKAFHRDSQANCSNR